MKALVCEALSQNFSGIAVRTRPEPVPGPGEVRVRLKAGAVNFPDVLMTQGLYQFKPEPPFVLGMEGAGIIDAIGAGVTRAQVGSAVIVSGRLGTFAEILVVPQAQIRPMPAGFSFAEAAAFSTAALTAYVSLVRRGALERGEWLLVLGAGGGVGMAAVSLGRHLGANVIAAASSDEKRAAALAQGAHHAIDSGTGMREAVKALTGGCGVDVVYDPVGGAAFDAAARLMAFGGRYLVVGFASGAIPSISINMPLIKGYSIVGVRAGEYGRQYPDKGRENMSAIDALASQGIMRPHIGARYALDQGVDGLKALAQRRAIGKVVLEVV